MPSLVPVFHVVGFMFASSRLDPSCTLGPWLPWRRWGGLSQVRSCVEKERVSVQMQWVVQMNTGVAHTLMVRLIHPIHLNNICLCVCVCVGFQVLLLLLYVCVLLALYLTPLTISSPCIMDRSNLKPQPTIISRRGAPMVLKCSFIHLYYHLLCNVFTPTLVCQASHKPHLHFAFITAKSVPLRRPQED